MTRNFRGNRMIPAKLNKGNLIPYINQPARRFCTAKMWLLLRGTTTQPLQGSRKNPTERMSAFRIPVNLPSWDRVENIRTLSGFKNTKRKFETSNVEVKSFPAKVSFLPEKLLKKKTSCQKSTNLGPFYDILL